MKKLIIVVLVLAMMLSMSSCAFLLAKKIEPDMNNIPHKGDRPETSVHDHNGDNTQAKPVTLLDALENEIPANMIQAGINELLDEPDDVWDSTSTRGRVTLTNITYECAIYFEGNGMSDKSVYLVYYMDVKYEEDGFQTLEGSIYHSVEFEDIRLNGNGIIEYDDIETDCHNGSMESLRSKSLSDDKAYHEVFRFGQESIDDLKDYYDGLLGKSYEITYIP